ncbi:zinc finger CCCH domain-containing protein 11A-like [Brachionichthys hirsutus]|uniref:zinc finger CCCH domain-containing protein 11A-like n=1 Tax=Brachionichthys hirsutus TaxID=412623 RepID=UPI003604D4E3
MSNRGDDCYFFYYSTCTKGDGCPFRHCEAAVGCEAVCSLWEERRCFSTTCRFRHMAITKRRKEILCYWEKQPDGCQKPRCAFFHQKPRCIGGWDVPADTTSQSQSTERPSEEPAHGTTTPPLPTAPNPQPRSVIKAESQEPVPSPTRPPVVIGPADEDEDDRFSEEGDDGKFGISPRKLHKSGGSLNFGFSTLEEIRFRKALKASVKRQGYPLRNADATASRERENANSSFRPRDGKDGKRDEIQPHTARPRGGVAERLGRKTSGADEQRVEGVRLKRSLSERLGRVVDRGPPQKVLKTVKERLGFPTGSGAGEVRVKTLEEIRREKAERLPVQQPSEDRSKKSSDGEENKPRLPPLLKPAPREKPVKPQPAAPKSSVANGNSVKVKTFEEIVREKRLRRQETEKARVPAEAEPSQKPPAEGTLKRKFPAAVSLTPPDSAPPDSSPTESDSPSATRSKEVAPKTASKSKQARTAAQSPAAEANGTPKKRPKKSREHTPAKVRPKRRGAGRSAVAAVKPLNSASAGLEEQLQEATCGDVEVFRSIGAEAQLSPAFPHSPVAALDLSSSPPSAELQTIPVFKQSAIVPAVQR